MPGFVGDLRYGLRGLARNRGFTAVAVLSLALGIGANTTIFTLLNAVFLRSMPVQEPESLATLVTMDGRNPGQFGISYPNYLDLRDHNTVFSSLLLYSSATVTLTGHGDPRLLMAHVVSGNYFRSLGVSAGVGRSFLPEEDGAPGSAEVAMISHGLWTLVYGGEPGITSQSIELNGRRYRIIGVTPKRFAGLNQLAGADVFLPMSAYPQIFPTGMVTQRRMLLFSAVGRLKPGVTLPQAGAGMQALGQELERQFPAENRNRQIRLISLAEAAMSERTRPLASKAGKIVLAVSLVVLLIACGNVASLLLARATARNREFAIRLALGAARGRLIRQLLTESLLLSMIGGLCGLLVARWVRDVLWSLRPPVLNHAAFDLDLDGRVLLFAFGMSLLTGILFGLFPALRATNPDLAGDLKERGSASGGLSRVWSARSVLVIAQVALSLLALVGAGLFLRSLQNATQIDMGFDAPHLAAVVYNVTDQGYNEARGRDFHQRVLERAAAVPGVASVSLSHDLPFHVGFKRRVALDGEEPHATLTGLVYPGYFQTMRMPLLRGRDFSPMDTKTTPRVAIVNQAAAASLWPGAEPIGQHFSFAGEGLPVEVVGVARNANYQDIGEAAQPLVFLSMVQYYFPSAVLYVRASGDPAPVIASVKRELQLLDRNLMLQAETMEVSMRDLLWVQRLSAGLLATFGALALILSTLGLYGVISYSVRQRTRELGIRIAFGATSKDLRMLILREGIRLVAIGVLIGMLLALSTAESVGGLLLLRNPRDVFTFTLVPSLLVLVGVIACWAPTRRASMVDPAIALRDE